MEVEDIPKRQKIPGGLPRIAILIFLEVQSKFGSWEPAAIETEGKFSDGRKPASGPKMLF
jgi:hypothetical protein